jgi:hypothetical protein
MGIRWPANSSQHRRFSDADGILAVALQAISDATRVFRPSRQIAANRAGASGCARGARLACRSTRGAPRVSLHARGSSRTVHETCLEKKRPRRGSARALGEFRSWVATPHRSGAKPSACCCPVARRPARAAVHCALDHLRRESPAGRPETLVGGRCPRIRIHAPRDIASRRSPLHRAFPSVRPHRRARRRVRGRVGRADIRAARARASLQRARGKALDPPRSFESRAEFE